MSLPKEDGGPAFPVTYEDGMAEKFSVGMSLRAYLAAKAICLFKGDVSTEFIARSCCNIADALIAELEKPEGGTDEEIKAPGPKFKKGQTVRIIAKTEHENYIGVITGSEAIEGGEWRYGIQLPTVFLPYRTEAGLEAVEGSGEEVKDE